VPERPQSDGTMQKTSGVYESFLLREFILVS
jgi:hypothetical protein